jgi:hypothetical protein
MKLLVQRAREEAGEESLNGGVKHGTDAVVDIA